MQRNVGKEIEKISDQGKARSVFTSDEDTPSEVRGKAEMDSLWSWTKLHQLELDYNSLF